LIDAVSGLRVSVIGYRIPFVILMPRYQSPHILDRLFDRIVFPITQYRPASRPESLVRIPVSSSVSLDLRFPPFVVVSRNVSVFGTAMPEAAVNKYGNPSVRESNVYCAPRNPGDRVFDPITETILEEGLPNLYLRPG
jgi:hypothetical protein